MIPSASDYPILVHLYSYSELHPFQELVTEFGSRSLQLQYAGIQEMQIQTEHHPREGKYGVAILSKSLMWGEPNRVWIIPHCYLFRLVGYLSLRPVETDNIKVPGPAMGVLAMLRPMKSFSLETFMQEVADANANS